MTIGHHLAYRRTSETVVLLPVIAGLFVFAASLTVNVPLSMAFLLLVLAALGVWSNTVDRYLDEIRRACLTTPDVSSAGSAAGHTIQRETPIKDQR